MTINEDRSQSMKLVMTINEDRSQSIKYWWKQIKVDSSQWDIAANEWR